MQKINAVIVDDEVNNVELLAHFLKEYCPLVNIVGKASTISESIVLINKLNPQLLFLDIVLDSGTGFDLLENLNHNNFKVIFVTAYNEFAIKAFKFNAVDYILKPLQITDLVKAVNKSYEEIIKEQYTSQHQLNFLSETISNTKEQINFIAIPSIDKIVFVKIGEIISLESDGRYCSIHLLDGKKLVACKNLGEYEKILPANLFFRIHHSHIVNLTHVLNLNKSAGNYCEMVNGKFLPVAKRRQNELLKFLNIK